MAPTEKSPKCAYVAPGTLGQRRIQNVSSSKMGFLPGLASNNMCKGSSGDINAIVSKKSQVSGNIRCTNKEVTHTNIEVPPASRGDAPASKEDPPPASKEVPSAEREVPSTDKEASGNDVQPSEREVPSASKEVPNAPNAADYRPPEICIAENAIVPGIESRKRSRRPDAKPRGVNKCKKVADLRERKKLKVDYYYNGPVGDNQKDFVRHIGKIFRDRNICSVKVHSWSEISEDAKEHMWQALLNKFVGREDELNRKSSLERMKRLWQNWRGILSQEVKKKGGVEDAAKSTPNDLTQDDWRWLLYNHFASDSFEKVSKRNSSNRADRTMLHRTGSKPFRQVIWEDLGGKEGKTPLISEIFKKTRKTKSGVLNKEEAGKYILRVEKENPSFSQFEVVEECFGDQDRDSVVCFGHGLRPKHVPGPLPTRSDLRASLRQKDKENAQKDIENAELRKRIEVVERNSQIEREKNEKQRSEMEKKLNMVLNACLQPGASGLSRLDAAGSGRRGIASSSHFATQNLGHLSSWTDEQLGLEDGNDEDDDDIVM